MENTSFLEMLFSDEDYQLSSQEIQGEDYPQTSMILPVEGTSTLQEDSQLAPFPPAACNASVTPPSHIHASAPPVFFPPTDEEMRCFLSSQLANPQVLETQEHTLSACESSIQMGEVIQVPNSSGPHLHLKVGTLIPTFSTIEGGVLESCSKFLSNPNLVETPGNSGAVPLSSQEIVKEIKLIIAIMIGKAKFAEMKDTAANILSWLQERLPSCLRDLQEKVRRDIENSLLLLEEETDIDVKLQKVGEKLFFPLRLNMEKNGHPILPRILSSLRGSLMGLKEKSISKVTLEEVKHATSNLVYLYLREQKKKPIAHPQHIKDIPREWRLENSTFPGKCYLPENVREAMADYCGLEAKQVNTLLGNNLKREAKKSVLLAPHLKGHFPHLTTSLLRFCFKMLVLIYDTKASSMMAWQAQNPKQIPKGNALKALMDATNLTEKKIKNWFGNHNRKRSK